MVKCICLNDKGKPKKIPTEKWVKNGQEYTIIFASYVLPQKELAFQIEELELDESCFPYEYFLANRFGFTLEELDKLIDFINECNDISISVKELMELTFAALRLFAPCTKFQVTTNVDGANSTKPLLPAGADYLAGF